MTASWLIQMGWPEVYVLAGGIPKEGLEAGSVPAPVLGLDALGVVEITASSLRDMLADETVTVLDLADSLT
ncbi:MAG TPA: thiosulfate sulfurtransferase, partial [Alphaproteobacteria bacterium]|nr:thiosulfate sulfurtransferase [Alphaproteobacteria bacterium]